MSQSFKIPKITLGGNVFGWTIDEKESFKILDFSVQNGLNFIDTADVYSLWHEGNKGGESETIIGNWIKKRGKRDDLLIATKLGWDLGNGKKGLSKKYMKEAINASLKRLNTDYVDLYISHRDDEETPLEETMEAFNELIKEGKVREIGSSNIYAKKTKETNDYAKKNGLKGYIRIQTQYN
ncbi:MAG: aldo/keto reductase [Campylobacteraceae bacterium]